MVNSKIKANKRNTEVRLKNYKNSDFISEEEFKHIKEFLRLAGLGKINKGKKISEARQLKYLDILKHPISYFDKDLDKLNIKDVESFIQDLENDKITKQNSKPYAHSTKIDIKRMFIVYLRYRIEDKEKFNNLTSWIDTREKDKSPEYLSEEEVLKLYKGCNTDKHRFLVAVLFDTGARVEEFLNIRYEDITEPTQNFPYYKINFKPEYSKTKGRNIGCYWDKSTEAIKEFMKERKDIDPGEPIYPDKYGAVRMFLKRLGKRVLERRVYPHLLRHSSATFYASKMNRQQLCIRYGWKFSSDMPDTYISRAGMEEKEVKDEMLNNDLGDIKKDLKKFETTIGTIKEKQEFIEDIVNEIKKKTENE